MVQSLTENQEKIQKLNQFLSAFFSSDPKELSKIAKENQELLKSVSPIDLFYLSWFQDNTPFSSKELMDRAGKMVNLFHHGLDSFSWNRECSTMMILFRQENEVIEQKLLEMSPYISKIPENSAREFLSQAVQSLSEIKKKFSKTENLLYPILEPKVPTRIPFRVLWRIHDEIRNTIKDVLRALSDPKAPLSDLYNGFGTLFDRVMGLIEKEELILYPIASLLINDDEWVAMLEESKGIGYAFGAHPVPITHPTFPKDRQTDHFLSATGDLPLESIELILNTLPMELTFIDENDIIRYFNDTKEKVFTRTPQIIGRNIELCHPEKSLPVLRKMLLAFRKGEANAASMQEAFGERIFRIEYRAVRNRDGVYKGTLEIIQEITDFRIGTDENRILSFDTKKAVR